MTVSAPTCDLYRTAVDRRHESELYDSNFNTLDKAKTDTPFSEHMWSLYTFNHVTRKFASHKQCAHHLSDVTAHYTIQLTFNKISVAVRGIYDVWQIKGLMLLHRKSENSVNCLSTWLSSSPSGGRGGGVFTRGLSSTTETMQKSRLGRSKM
jgi:hypothetical protein